MKAIGWASLGLALLFWAGIGWRLVRYPENHAGFNVLWSLALFAGMGVVAVGRRLLTGRFDGQIYALLGTALVSAVAVVLIYKLNVLLPYEVWLKRGMPPRPF
jgi:hypothetical protein